MTYLPLDSTHTRQRWAWHDITTVGQHTRSDGVRRGMPSSPLDYLTQSDGVGSGMPSAPLDGKQGRTTSGVACHHHLWAAQTVERQRAWHSIIAFGLAHIVRRLWAWHAIIALGQQTRSNDFGRGMPSSPLGSTHGRTMSSVASHHRPWTARTFGRRQAWHDITALAHHTRSATSGLA